MLPARGAAAAAAGQAAGVVPLHQKPGTRTTTTITARARRRQQPQQQQQQQQQQSRSIITASGRRRTVCCALWGSSSSNDSSNNGGGDGDDGGVGPFNGVPPKRSRHAHNSGRRSAEAERRGRALLDYAMGVKPSAMDEFAASAPAAVVGAMRATCANMLGTLPPAYFEVRVLTEPQTLAHLFFSAAMTGWMFRNAALRLELRSALAGAALDASPPALPQAGAASASAAGPLGAPPSLQASQRGGQGPTGAAASAPSAAAAAAGPTTPPAPAAAVAAAATAGAPPAAYWSPALHAQYAPGAQKHRVEGDVLLWHNERGVERLAAAGYMEALEGEVARLRAALAGAGAGTQGAGTGARAAAAAAAAALAFEGGGAGAGPFGPASVVAPAAAVGGGGEPAALQVFPPMPAGGGAAAGGAAGAGGGGGAAAPFAGGNPLLEYLRALDPASLKDLTAGIGDGAAAAVDAFVARMLGVASARDGDALRRCGPSECSAAELGRALFWLMVVGYTLRSLEMRLDMGGVSGAGGGGEAGGGGLRLSALLPGGGGGGGMPFARREGWKWPSL